ncbi:DUF3043 domain-containing protein [Arachnia propionica]|uniref:DUF3043 domain-containing protein n=1 Tax=Arachnia propionica TaxID=1750 RepID=A0A3P1WYH2_9ACTN|nr:DUF3043 domain-containing protein [Arachnia propionica]RRD50968.1 DUF3043 domain-containing protein [Arachnia propionica]
MGLFHPYERKTDTTEDRPRKERTRLVPKDDRKERKAAEPSSKEATTPETRTEETSSKVTVKRRQPARKNQPTMTRKQAEAARMERLHPNLSPKEQRKADREARSKARMEAWDRIEASPERTLARDYVDARWTITEFMMPAMLVVMAGVMLTMSNVLLSSYIALLLWVLLLLSFINTFFMWRSFKKLLAERVPRANKRGLLMYMFNRALMIRRFRRPSPRINRGDPV